MPLTPPFAFNAPRMTLMKRFQWAGEDEIQLGRFGIVRRGDVLLLTDQEAAMVLANRDKRYVAVPDGKEPKEVEHFKVIDPSKMTPTQMEQAEKDNHDEQERLLRLDVENDEERVALLALGQKNTVDLILLANEANAKEGRQIIPTVQGTTRSVLITELAKLAGREAAARAAEKSLQESGKGA